ncbi:MAG: hypothetical protein QOI81_281, partial [Actinomycetota bacterium]|nr:hypothetical protein [Actinomycetota bacterium]
MGDSRFHTFAWEVPTPGRTSGASRNIDLRYVERTVLVGVTYYIAAVLGLRLALVGHQVTPVWPPTGVALVGFLLFGRRIWPGVAIAAFFVNLPLGPTTTAALGIAVGNTLAPLFAATLLGKGRFRLELNRFRDALILVFLGALVGMTVSATWGSLTLLAAGGVRTSEFWQTWWTWWAGDAMGVLAVAPFLLSLRSVRFDRHGSWGRRLEAVTGFAVLAVVATLAFRGPVRIEYLVFPLLVWAAWRFGQRGAAPAALLTISIATLAAVQGTGMFAHDSLLGKMASLQVFNASVALASFVLAAILAERRRAQEDLRQHQEWVNGMLDSAPGAIMVVDEGGDVLLANPRAEEIFGYEAGALVGVSIESVVPETLRADHLRHRSDYLDDVSSRPMGQGMDLTGRRRDGSEFPVEIGLSSFATPERRLVTAFINDITLRKRAEQELEHMALHDPLTGLANRAVFMERLTQALARTERRPSSVAVLFIDLDHFKTINDNFGHEVGDRVLKSVGDRLRHALRPEDTAARFGGDEFVVLCEDLEDERHLVTIADRIMSAVSEPIPLETGEIVITPSIGIATTRGV